MDQALSERQGKMAKAALWLGAAGVALALVLMRRPATRVTGLLSLAALFSSVAAVIVGILAVTAEARLEEARLRLQATIGIALGLLYPAFLVVFVLVRRR